MNTILLFPHVHLRSFSQSKVILPYTFYDRRKKITFLFNFNVEIRWAKEMVRWRSRESSEPTPRIRGAGRRPKEAGGHRF